MPLTDPLGDLLAGIRNAQRVAHKTLDVPSSKLKSAVLEVLKREGYIRGFYGAQDAGRIFRYHGRAEI